MTRKIGRVKLPAAARRLARSALEVRTELHPDLKFGTETGVYVARRIAASETVDGDRVLGFLERWRPAYQSELRAGRSSPRKSKTVGAYFLWGGAPALAHLRRLKSSRR